MSKASAVEIQNRNMLQTAVADRKLSEAQIRAMLFSALYQMSTFEMEQMLLDSLHISLEEFIVNLVPRNAK